MFPISLWNINARVNHNLPRTTNRVEGCHSKINRLVSSHPSIWKHIDVLRKDSANNHYNMAQALRDNNLPQEKRKYPPTLFVLQSICFGITHNKGN